MALASGFVSVKFNVLMSPCQVLSVLYTEPNKFSIRVMLMREIPLCRCCLYSFAAKSKRIEIRESIFHNIIDYVTFRVSYLRFSIFLNSRGFPSSMIVDVYVYVQSCFYIHGSFRRFNVQHRKIMISSDFLSVILNS